MGRQYHNAQPRTITQPFSEYFIVLKRLIFGVYVELWRIEINNILRVVNYEYDYEYEYEYDIEISMNT